MIHPDKDNEGPEDEAARAKRMAEWNKFWMGPTRDRCAQEDRQEKYDALSARDKIAEIIRTLPEQSESSQQVVAKENDATDDPGFYMAA